MPSMSRRIGKPCVQGQQNSGPHIVLPIIYPNRLGTGGLVSTMRVGQDPQLLDQIMVRDGGGSCAVADPIVDVLLSAARETRCRLFVQDHDPDHAYEIVPEAWHGLRPGFLAAESLTTGSFILAPRLLRHGMKELGLDGQPLLIANPVDPQSPSGEHRLVGLSWRAESSPDGLRQNRRGCAHNVGCGHK